MSGDSYPRRALNVSTWSSVRGPVFGGGQSAGVGGGWRWGVAREVLVLESRIKRVLGSSVLLWLQIFAFSEKAFPCLRGAEDFLSCDPSNAPDC